MYDPEVPTVEKAYEILNLPNGASRDEVRQRYHNLSLQHHPDKNLANSAPFPLIDGAYKRLMAHFRSQNT